MDAAHFTNIPSKASSLGRGRRSFIYNDCKFSLQAFEKKETINTNQNALRKMTNNIQAAGQKKNFGMGMGQYLDPRELGGFNVSHIDLIATVKGQSFSARIDVTADGDYKSKNSSRTTSSLKLAATQMMDSLFRHVGMTDIFESGSQLTNPVSNNKAQTMRMGMR